MSVAVKERLKEFGMLESTTHEDRIKIDRLIEIRTGMFCDEGAEKLTDDEFLEIVNFVLKKKLTRIEIV